MQDILIVPENIAAGTASVIPMGPDAIEQWW
jgi:hypothetical protein